MFLAAAAAQAPKLTALDKLKAIPTQFWLIVGGIIVGIVVINIVLNHLLKMNKIYLTIGTIMVVVLVGFNWVYKRNEPKFLTPLVNKIAPFLPSQIDYYGTQNTHVPH